jgi:hypothetical protein
MIFVLRDVNILGKELVHYDADCAIVKSGK